jgi:lia operon protein LiaG
LKRILIIFLVLIGCYLLLTSNIMNLFLFGKNNSEIQVTKRIDTIEVDVSSAQVNMIPEDRDNIRAELSGKGKVSMDKDGDTIKIDYKRGFFNEFQFFNKTPKLNIYIPADYSKSLELKVGSGYLVFEGPSDDDPISLDRLSIDMSSGKVDLKNIKAKEFEHEGSSGLADIDTLTAESASVRMSSGKAKIKDLKGKLDAKISSGLMDIQLSEVTDAVELQASSGQIKLDLPDDADFMLNGKSSSGFIECDLPLKDKISEKGKIKGTFGTGEHPIDVQVSSGHVKIY